MVRTLVARQYRKYLLTLYSCYRWNKSSRKPELYVFRVLRSYRTFQFSMGVTINLVQPNS